MAVSASSVVMSVLCGKPTPDGTPCRRPVKTAGAACGAVHPDPAAVVPVDAGAAAAGPGPDPLSPVEAFDLVDPRDGGVPVEAMTDSQLAYAAGLAGVNPVGAPEGADRRGWLEAQVADWVAGCPPRDWKTMRMGWSWADGDDGGAGEWDFAVDPVAHPDERAAKRAIVAALIESVTPDGPMSTEPPDVPYALCWGDVSEWMDRDTARARGVMLIDRPGVEPSGGYIVCDPVGHDETIFDPTDVAWSLSMQDLEADMGETLARWDPGVAAGRIAEMTDPADLERWSTHWGGAARAAAAANPATPPEALARLAGDPDSEVSRAAAHNPSCPPADRARAGLLAD